VLGLTGAYISPEDVQAGLNSVRCTRDTSGNQIMMDVVWTGGITEAQKIATLADSFHLPVTPHDCTGLEVGQLAELCLLAQVINGGEQMSVS
jgi:L-alanine-DL-glutamate epimerase-like enolase superfamily enzyme